MRATYSDALSRAGHRLWCHSEDNERQMQRLQEKLLQAIEEVLTPRQRQILLLCFFENMSVSQIAEHLHIAKSTVSRSLKRSVEKLEKTLHYSL